ncbi:MAG: hypothetical protein ACREJ3_14995 [Polyangiaceae bacterium]
MIAAAALASACGATDAEFRTNFAPGFAPARHAVSVLGVFKDGQMSADSWDTLAARISAPLGAGAAHQAACETAYSPRLTASNPALSSTIDDYTRSNGPTDALLEQLAPAAKGDLILVLTLAGRLPQHKDSGGSMPTSTPMTSGGGMAGGMGGMGGTGGMGGGAARQARIDPGTGPTDTNELDMSASLFSVKSGRSVALVAMKYSGASEDDAIARFAAKLGEALPGATCTGWNFDGTVDAARIRKSIDP